MSAPLLEVCDLKRRYGNTVALDGVSFHVQPGEVFGLLGPNGAGKTTCLSILSCLLEPSAGKVTLQGEPIVGANGAIRRRIGIVPQELAVYDELTAHENLLFFGQLYSIDRAELGRRAEQILIAMGLEDRAHDRVQTFSGGMKRRLNLGIALMHQPLILLLDEPTTGVDPQSRNRIFEEIRRVNRAGMTIVYTSHYMEEVQALCTRIGIIDHGKLIACDTLAGLLRQLAGLINVRVGGSVEILRERCREIPGVLQITVSDDTVQLECQNVKTALIRLVALLNELQLELTHLETEEPNLERVFLHLTGRALRD